MLTECHGKHTVEILPQFDPVTLSLISRRTAELEFCEVMPHPTQGRAGVLAVADGKIAPPVFCEPSTKHVMVVDLEKPSSDAETAYAVPSEWALSHSIGHSR